MSDLDERLRILKMIEDHKTHSRGGRCGSYPPWGASGKIIDVMDDTDGEHVDIFVD